ncbi:PTS system N-acetylglucosamine-specific IIC component [Entomoplasma freundtii]|uniref:PTS system, N-acetylglucosamine-specific IIBC component n=1 Tax=Entomoplasma freundtii TaxID=74700 RepID=A0A2K8NQU8_9MOLU|nr:PTS transporter subunit EIIC [Entomoplasma freundtii]ATZ16225.1 PTS system, N-acetylglucosamine-specific IIBC component [Entomoplasma freundtii]TDY56874.1 PTS system N-acetylglucosamine-specific IIC component [Entomoplasma freundtii]
MKNSLNKEQSSLQKFHVKPFSKEGHKKFWSDTLLKLQNLGKALLYPIAILPFAALLNRFGALAISLNPIAEDGTRNAGNWIGFIIQTPGKIVFDNLALFFAIGTAFGLSKDNRGEAALVGAVLYFALTGFLAENGLASLFYKNVLQMEYYVQDADGNYHLIKGLSQLFYVPTYGKILVPGAETETLEKIGGQFILNIGVVGGITAGCFTAWLYNKYRDIKLPMYLSFFGGRRFVPMVVMLISLPLAFIFAIIWPWIQFGLVKLGQTLSSGDAWAVPGAFIYALVNRFTQPFGLHHIINTFLWFQLPVQGPILDPMTGKMVLGADVIPPEVWESAGTELMKHLNEIAGSWKNLPNGGITGDNFKDYFTYRPNLVSDVILSMGNGTYAVFGDINAFQQSLLSGNFQTGYFPMYWGGLPGAALAMIMASKKENRKQVTAFLGGVAVVALLTGIDEPIVFAFIFVGPILWVYNAVFCAIFASIAVAMHMHIGFGFSGGLIDYIISFPTSWGMSKFEGLANGNAYGVLSNPLWMLLLAALMFPLYYYSFYFTIKKMDIKTPGRDDQPTNIQAMSNKTDQKSGDKYSIMANEIIRLVGEENIVKVDNCATRLRLTVKDNKIGSDQEYKNLGAYGVKRLGDEALQIIIGTDVEHVANKVHEITNK